MQTSQAPLLIDKTETFIVLHGLKKLLDENEAMRKTVINLMAPGDNHVPTLLETFDKRAAQLQQLASKFTALANNS